MSSLAGAPVAASAAPLLSVRGLVTEFLTPDGPLRAVDDVSFDVHPGEIVGLVGESGSGKSATAFSILRLLPRRTARVVSGQILFDGRDLGTMSSQEMRAVRGSAIAMVFQDPASYLNPLMRIGRQVSEAVEAHNPGLSRADLRRRALELLELVGIANARGRLDQYPHEFSVGMRQRVIIAMAIANKPRVLIADEPTTALDVTVQAQVMDVLRRVHDETQAATVLITHDLGLAGDFVDRVLVMYAGRVVEDAPVAAVFSDPRHPYTIGLMASLPHLDVQLRRLPQIPGQPASAMDLPSGCPFHPRCSLARDRERCRTERPALAEVAQGHRSACHFSDELGSDVTREVEELFAPRSGGDRGTN